MKKQILIFGILTILIFTASCSFRVMDFTLISSKNVELSKFPTYERAKSRVEGEDTKPIILIIPTGHPDGKEAIDRAIESTPGAVALVDGVLTYKYFYIPLLFGEYTYVIEGTPLIDPSYARIDKINELDDYSICLLDKSGAIRQSIKVGEEEYYNIREDIFKSPKRMYKKIQKD